MDESGKQEAKDIVDALLGFGWTLRAIAEAIGNGVGKSTVSDWQGGATPRKKEVKQKLWELHAKEISRREYRRDTKSVVYEQEIRRLTARVSTSAGLDSFLRLDEKLASEWPNVIQDYSNTWHAQQLHFLRAEYRLCLDKILSFPETNEIDEATEALESVAVFSHAQALFYLGHPIDQLVAQFSRYERPDRHNPIISLDQAEFSYHAEVLRLGHLSLIMALLDDPKSADARVEQGLSFAERMDPQFQSAAHTWAADVHYVQGSYQSALHHANIALELAGDTLPVSIGIANIHRGLGLTALNRDPDGPSMIVGGINLLQEIEIYFAQTFWLEILARAQLILGLHAEGLETIERAFQFGHETGEKLWFPALKITQAELLLLDPRVDLSTVEQLLDDAIGEATRMASRLVQRRAEELREKIQPSNE